MAKKKAPPTQLENVLGQLRELVLKGRFAPHSKLEEKQLAELLGVSRTPVRLALQSLAQEGLLVYNPHRGFHVRAFTSEEVVNAIEVRGRLEAFACERLAMQGIEPASAELLRRNLAATRELLALPSPTAADVDVWVGLNDEFHRILTTCARNPLVVELIQHIGKIPMASAALVPTMTDNVDSVFDYVADAVRMHEQVFDAILRREPMRAHNLMLEHVHQGRLRMMSFIESWPDDQSPEGYPALRRLSAVKPMPQKGARQEPGFRPGKPSRG
jgi:GntR family transcriptional regulator of vanillate catabolism